jgi:hypothetical protein
MRLEPRRLGLDADPVQIDPLRALGLYYAASGAWPLINMRSFELVTGAKTDKWLVQSFGALVSAIGCGLLASRGPGGRRDAARIGTFAALAIAVSETIFVARGKIRPIYLADAALELVFVVAMMRASGPRATSRVTVTA